MEQRKKGRVQTQEELQTKVRLGGLHRFSLIDYPDRISAIIFTQGCNFRCYYCHNPELVYPGRFHKPLSPGRIMDFLKKRRGQLEGVVITGGEPLYQPGIADFIKSIKSLNYSVKVDTNGSFPEKLAGIIDAGLLDYVAMDIKAPLKDYRKIIRVEVNLERIRQSITLLINSGIDIEFRITLAEEICSLDSMESMASLIQGAGIVYLQKCNFKNATEKSRAELDQYMEVFTQRGIKCYFR